MEKIEQLKGKVFPFPMTPSRWVATERKQYLEIAMTAGGGMGGSRWYEYIEPRALPTDELILVMDIDGNEKYINTRYVTNAQLVTVLTAKYFSTNSLFMQYGRTDIVRRIVGEQLTVRMEGNSL